MTLCDLKGWQDTMLTYSTKDICHTKKLYLAMFHYVFSDVIQLLYILCIADIWYSSRYNSVTHSYDIELFCINIYKHMLLITKLLSYTLIWHKIHMYKHIYKHMLVITK